MRLNRYLGLLTLTKFTETCARHTQASPTKRLHHSEHDVISLSASQIDGWEARRKFCTVDLVGILDRTWEVYSRRALARNFLEFVVSRWRARGTRQSSRFRARRAGTLREIILIANHD